MILEDVQRTLEQHGFGWPGPLRGRFLSIQYGSVNVFHLPYDFLNNISFSLAYSIVRI